MEKSNHRSTGSPSAKQPSVWGCWLDFSIHHFRSELQRLGLQTWGTSTPGYAQLLRAHLHSTFCIPWLRVASGAVRDAIPPIPPKTAKSRPQPPKSAIESHLRFAESSRVHGPISTSEFAVVSTPPPRNNSLCYTILNPPSTYPLIRHQGGNPVPAPRLRVPLCGGGSRVCR